MKIFPHLFCLLRVVAVGMVMLVAQTADGGVWDIPRTGGETITEPSPEATAMRSYQDYPVSTPRFGRMISTNHYHIGPFQFTNNSTIRAIRLERVNLPWGYFDANLTPMVNLTDYQGNIRGVYSQYSATTAQTTDYYPYGLPMATSTNPSVNNYKYSGKELHTDLGFDTYDFHARTQLPAQLRFSRPDPKAGNYPWLNPYLYCAANPIMNTDPTGEDVKITIENTSVGTTSIYLYSASERRNNKISGPLTTIVPVYEVNVENDSGDSQTYYFTRIGYRKDVKNQEKEATEVTFDVVNDGDSFAGVIKSRWGGKDNVLEFRDEKTGFQTISAKKGKEPAKRIAIQQHVKGATDGCQMSVGYNDFISFEPNSNVRTDLPKTSTQAQQAYMNTIKAFLRNDAKNKSGQKIKIIVRQIYPNEK